MASLPVMTICSCGTVTVITQEERLMTGVKVLCKCCYKLKVGLSITFKRHCPCAFAQNVYSAGNAP